MGVAFGTRRRLLVAGAAVAVGIAALAGGEPGSQAAANAAAGAQTREESASSPRRTFHVSRYGASGNGSNEIAALRRAVAAANARPGSDVVLGPKTYVIRTTTPYEVVLRLTRGTRILGTNGSRLEADAEGAEGPVMIGSSDEDVAVQGVAIDMGAKKDGIAIRLDGATRTRITASRFTRVGTAGVYLAGATSHTLIRRNAFVGAGYGVLAHDASTARRVDIVENTFVGGRWGDAIEINTPDGRATNWNINRNKISGYSARGPGSGLGIGIAHASRITIADNTIERIGWRGIHIENGSTDITIIRNTIRNTAQEAVYAVLGTSAMRNFRVEDNTFLGNGSDGYHGVYFVPGGVFQPFENVNIVSNHFFLNGAVGARGIAAIALDGYVKDAVIADNFIANQLGSYPGGRGVGLSIGGDGGSGRISIVRNTVVNGGLGLLLHGAMSDTTAADNVFIGHTVASIRNAATGNIRTEGNVAP